MTKEALATAGQKKEKRAYSKPHLIEYGQVEELTQGGSGELSDFGGHHKATMG